MPPAVSSTSPANNATNVAVGTTISVHLSEETFAGPGFGDISLKDEAGNTVPAAINYNSGYDEYDGPWTDTRTIMIDPTANLEAGKTYTVAVPADAVRDKDGNPNSQYSFSFSTPLL